MTSFNFSVALSIFWKVGICLKISREERTRCIVGLKVPSSTYKKLIKHRALIIQQQKETTPFKKWAKHMNRRFCKAGGANTQQAHEKTFNVLSH